MLFVFRDNPGSLPTPAFFAILLDQSLLRLFLFCSIKRLQFVLLVLVHVYIFSTWNLRCYLCEAPGTPGVTCVGRASAEMLTGSLPELKHFSMSSYNSAQTPSIPKADKPNGP